MCGSRLRLSYRGTALFGREDSHLPALLQQRDTGTANNVTQLFTQQGIHRTLNGKEARKTMRLERRKADADLGRERRRALDGTGRGVETNRSNFKSG